jgi:hypothetical protein
VLSIGERESEMARLRKREKMSTTGKTTTTTIINLGNQENTERISSQVTICFV